MLDSTHLFKIGRHILVPLFAIVFLIFMNASFVAAEFALVKIRRTRLEELQEDGVVGAKSALYCVDNLRRMLSATQLGVTIASLSVGWVGESWLANVLFPVFQSSPIPKTLQHFIGAAISLIILTFIHVVLGELVPKNIAISNAEKTLLFMARPLRFFVSFARPFIHVLSYSSSRILRWFGVEGLSEKPPSEDELKLIMEDSRDEGILSDGEAEIIKRAFEFADKKASDVMVPASKVNFVSLQHPFPENIDLIGKTRHARLPLCKESMEDLLGIIHTKDFWPLLDKESSNDLFQKIAHKPLIVPHTMKQDEVFKLLQRNRTHFAVVQNENGKNIGIITLEDVLEGLVGEFEERRFE